MSVFEKSCDDIHLAVAKREFRKIAEELAQCGVSS